MNKKEIINLAIKMGFKLDYDKYDDKIYPGDSSNLRFLRFVSKNDDLDEKDLRWIWYKNRTDVENIQEGEYIQQRLNKKKQIQELGEQLQEKINEIGKMSGFKGEADNAKSQLQHLDTFRNELIKERAEHARSLDTIAKLENKIAELQSPAKTKVKKAITKSVLPVEEETLKDGGTF